MLSRCVCALPARVRCFSSTTSVGATLRPMTGALGCEVLDVNLAAPSGEDVETIQKALHDWNVVFFRDQHDLDRDSHLALAKLLGTPDRHPIVTGVEGHPDIMRVVREAGAPTNFGETWHSDNSYMKTPSMGSILRGIEIPEYGNDTLFANMYLAYESLSDGLKATLDSLKGVHGAGRAFSTTDPTRADRYSGKAGDLKYQESEVLDEVVEHPVVRTHPVTGRKALYVNEMFTYRFSGWTDEESAPLLQYLFTHMAQPQFQCRFRWAPGSVAFWDNRCTTHLALGDMASTRRVIERITLEGEVPQ